jgi:hypothetical protein
VSKETYAERKERERRSARVVEFAIEEAAWIGQSNLVGWKRGDGRYPLGRFGFSPEIHRCDCGMVLAPFPYFNKFGMYPCFHCPLCNLDDIVKACERVTAEAAKP